MRIHLPAALDHGTLADGTSDGMPLSRSRSSTAAAVAWAKPADRPVAGVRPEPVKPAPPSTTALLPLFVHGMPAASEEADDEPLVKMPASPRPPLGVRRTTPDPARLRAKYARTADLPAPGPVERDLLDHLDPVAPVSHPSALTERVDAGKRLGAACVDALLIGAIDLAVLWFTLDVCQLKVSQILVLPLIPLSAFLLLLDGGYLVLFTAACGQTLGKMMAGIRVVGTSAEVVITNEIPLGQAVGRALATLVSVLPLGLGFWIALTGQGRALHDRLAHTRVVPA
jgi:uncharacterized RDD family membrane protein YckC